MTFTTFLPTHYNNGAAIPNEILEKILAHVTEHFGGCTLDHQGIGYWKDLCGGKVYRELVRRLTIVTDAHPKEVRSCILWIKIELNQESMYFGQTCDPVEFI